MLIFQTSPAKSPPIPLIDRSSYIVSMNDLKNSKSDQMLECVFDKSTPEEQDSQNSVGRQSERQDEIFELYPAQPPVSIK